MKEHKGPGLKILEDKKSLRYKLHITRKAEPERCGSLYPAEIVVQQSAFGGCCVFLPSAADLKEAIRICFLICKLNFVCVQSNMSDIQADLHVHYCL